MQRVAERCCSQVLRHAGTQGFQHSDFVTRVPEYRRATQGEQFRALVLLAKIREISSMIGSRGGWHFYPRSLAPPGSFNYERDRPRSRAEKLLDAADKG